MSGFTNWVLKTTPAHFKVVSHYRPATNREWARQAWLSLTRRNVKFPWKRPQIFDGPEHLRTMRIKPAQRYDFEVQFKTLTQKHREFRQAGYQEYLGPYGQCTIPLEWQHQPIEFIRYDDGQETKFTMIPNLMPMQMHVGGLFWRLPLLKELS